MAETSHKGGLTTFSKVVLGLQTYEQAQRAQKFDICSHVAAMVERWLLNLPGEAFRPALLMVLSEAIGDSQQVARQQATLTLLSMIAQGLTACPALVFDILIPPLLALTGLPAVGRFQPTTGLPISANLTIADPAPTALSFMGKQGPAGSLLPEVRHHCKDHPEQLRQLALSSLQSGTLMTPAVVPLAEDHFNRYATAIDKWMKLRDGYKGTRLTHSTKLIVLLSMKLCLTVLKK